MADCKRYRDEIERLNRHIDAAFDHAIAGDARAAREELTQARWGHTAAMPPLAGQRLILDREETDWLRRICRWMLGRDSDRSARTILVKMDSPSGRPMDTIGSDSTTTKGD